MALAFCLLGYWYLIRNKRKSFIFFVAIAVNFHYNAIVSLSLLFLDKITF
ncbi:EpsG family protein [Paenibacillus agaridevorans]